MGGRHSKTFTTTTNLPLTTGMETTTPDYGTTVGNTPDRHVRTFIPLSVGLVVIVVLLIVIIILILRRKPKMSRTPRSDNSRNTRVTIQPRGSKTSQSPDLLSDGHRYEQVVYARPEQRKGSDSVTELIDNTVYEKYSPN